MTAAATAHAPTRTGSASTGPRGLSAAEREPTEPETSEELDVEAPNESAPGHNPDPEEDDS